MVLTAAFPPFLNISSPAWVASGWVEETIPLVLWTTLRRLGKEMNCGFVVEYMWAALGVILNSSEVAIAECKWSRCMTIVLF